MLNGRPLYDNARDAELFVAPPEFVGLERATRRHVNVMLTGPRGVGKTTLLRQAQRTARETDVHVVYVDASAVDDAGELAVRLRGAITGARAPMSETMSVAVATFGRAALPPGGASRALYAELEAINAAPTTLVLVDATASADAVFGIFGRMRDVLWQGPHTWVVAIDESARATALRPPADAFFDVVITLGTWDPDRLVDMLRRRAPETPTPTLEEVAGASSGIPRTALRALSAAVVGGASPAEHLRASAILQYTAEGIGRSHGMLFAELLGRGQASPSDEDLQRSLGVGRARLTQLLRDLLEEDLVVADVGQPDGPGRPRTVYRPALPR